MTGRADTLQQQVAHARQNYFRAVEGDHASAERARDAFAALRKQQPENAVVLAYSGSLELLQAGRTLDVFKMYGLTNKGLADMDHAVELAPENVEVRYIRAVTDYHLPFFLKRKDQAQSDFAWLAPRMPAAASDGSLPTPLAASALDDYGQILLAEENPKAAQYAFSNAVRIDAASPGGQDAARHLQGTADGQSH